MTEPLSGVIVGRQFLDLTALQTPDEIAAITELADIQIVAVPESLASTLARIPTNDVQLIVPVPDGIRPRFHQGAAEFGGDALVHPGAHKDFLIVLGALVFTTPVHDRLIPRIAVVGTILAPVGSENALGAAVTALIGLTHYYPYAEGQQVKVFSGQSNIGPAVLANESGAPDDILIAAGQVMVTGPITKLGFGQVLMAGQVMLPKESQDVFGSVLQTYGQTLWYQGEPRFIFGSESYGRAFFELVEKPLALLIFGELRIESDVPAELLRDKVSGITLFGQIFAPKHLIPVVQYRTTEKFGQIEAVEDESE
jgi:hypothetical protein